MKLAHADFHLFLSFLKKIFIFARHDSHRILDCLAPVIDVFKFLASMVSEDCCSSACFLFAFSDAQVGFVSIVSLVTSLRPLLFPLLTHWLYYPVYLPCRYVFSTRSLWFLFVHLGHFGFPSCFLPFLFLHSWIWIIFSLPLYETMLACVWGFINLMWLIAGFSP